MLIQNIQYLNVSSSFSLFINKLVIYGQLMIKETFTLIGYCRGQVNEPKACWEE